MPADPHATAARRMPCPTYASDGLVTEDDLEIGTFFTVTALRPM